MPVPATALDMASSRTVLTTPPWTIPRKPSHVGAGTQVAMISPEPSRSNRICNPRGLSGPQAKQLDCPQACNGRSDSSLAICRGLIFKSCKVASVRLATTSHMFHTHRRGFVRRSGTDHSSQRRRSIHDRESQFPRSRAVSAEARRTTRRRLRSPLVFWPCVHIGSGLSTCDRHGHSRSLRSRVCHPNIAGPVSAAIRRGRLSEPQLRLPGKASGRALPCSRRLRGLRRVP